MRTFALVVGSILVASGATAAEIPRSTYAALGLPGFTKMSSAQAQGIRGRGFTLAISGSGWAGFNGATTTNAYSLAEAGTSGSHSTLGYNVSYALTGVPGSSVFVAGYGTSSLTTH